MAKKKMGRSEKEVTPEFRVSYPHVFKPQAMAGTNNPPEYSVTMLFAKDSDLTVMKKMIAQAKTEHFGPKEKWPKNIASPVTDGDLEKHGKKQGYADHWVIKAASHQDQKPGVYNQRVQPITEQSDFYPGCFAVAQVFARVWEFPENSGKFGVRFILDNVQKTKDGDSFSGKQRGEDVFKPVNGAAADGEDMTTDDTEEHDFA